MSEPRLYPTRPLVGIGIIVLRGDELLLIKRGRPPAQGEWSFPGGAQRLGETAEQAARRELLEETGLAVGELKLAGHVDSIHHDAEGRIAYHYTILDFCARYVQGVAQAAGDAADIMWSPRAHLKNYLQWQAAIEMAEKAFAIFPDGAPL